MKDSLMKTAMPEQSVVTIVVRDPRGVVVSESTFSSPPKAAR